MWSEDFDDSNLPENAGDMLEDETTFSRSFDSSEDLAVIPQSPKPAKNTGTSKSSLSLFSKQNVQKIFKRGKKDADEVGEDESLMGSNDADSVKRYTVRDEKEGWR